MASNSVPILFLPWFPPIWKKNINNKNVRFRGTHSWWQVCLQYSEVTPPDFTMIYRHITWGFAVLNKHWVLLKRCAKKKLGVITNKGSDWDLFLQYTSKEKFNKQREERRTNLNPDISWCGNGSFTLWLNKHSATKTKSHVIIMKKLRSLFRIKWEACKKMCGVR